MDISAGSLLAGIIFGGLGLVFTRRAMREGNGLAIALGVALMVYPYFVSNTWLQWIIGGALSFWEFRLLSQ